MLFRRMFFYLFSAVTEALCLIQAGCVKEAERKLAAAQQAMQENLISAMKTFALMEDQ